MTLSVYPSNELPIDGQVAGKPCPWCGKPLGREPHSRGSTCMSSFSAFQEAKIIAAEFQLVADLLQKKACVFGEEPLHGALVRAKVALSRLEGLVATHKSPKE